MAETIPTDALDLIDDPNFGIVVTIMEDGMPQPTPVWIDRDGGDILFNTAKGRVKHENMVRDNRVALTVVDPQNPYRYLQVRGTVTMADDPDNAGIHAMARKYLGTDYPWLREGEERVDVRLTPEDVQYAPPRG